MFLLKSYRLFDTIHMYEIGTSIFGEDNLPYRSHIVYSRKYSSRNTAVSTRKPNSYKRIRCSLPEIILLNRAPLTDKQKGEHTKTRNYIRRETSFEKYVSLESVLTVHERSLLRKISLSLATRKCHIHGTLRLFV